jgi:NTP pyrophosphatase (non-canonical NTP hydrolase)
MAKKTYREEMLRTANGHPEQDLLLLGAIGLCEEAGEVAGLIKKHHFHKHPMNLEKLKKELGDVRWYFELIIHSINSTIEEIEEVNIKKIYERFPDGFSPEASINRKKD